MSGEILSKKLYYRTANCTIVWKLENVNTMKQPELGKMISTLRQQKGLTQEELVAQCNINVRTIQRIEAGEVTPRSYTIKTIFSVLDFDLEAINAQDSSGFPVITDPRSASFLASHLKYAWIAGVIYFLTGFVEFAIDYARFFEDELILGNTGYISVKFIVLGSYIYFLRGFLVAGNLFKSYLLKLGALFLIGVSILFYTYDMISLYYTLFYIEYVVVVQSIFCGIGGFMLGFATLKLSKHIGTIASVAGGLIIACSVLFLTIILGWLGYLLLIPAVIAQIILLFKIEELIKEKRAGLL
jgi:transcriptional regulator with XRE-family HTH domain